MTVRISISVTNYTDVHLGRIARSAEQAGVDTVWVADHLIQADPTAVPDSEMLEAYTTLGYLAAHTERVRLGTMVSAVTFREPAVLVKAVTTLDHLSGGRAWLGIGAGYHGAEAGAMGLSMPPVPERFERLEETLLIALSMWADDREPFHGKHYHLDRPVGNPRPVRRPHPPILIGGSGERYTLRLVAQFGAACNLFDIPDGGATVRRKLSVLAEHCARVGRPFAEIEKTLSTRLDSATSAARFVDHCAGLAELGIEHAVVVTTGPWTDATLAEAVPALSA